MPPAPGPILIISGTNRPGSYARRVARVLEGHYLSQGVPADVLSLMELPLEAIASGVGYADVYAAPLAAMKPLQDRVLAAAGLHIVTPEYRGSFPGVLKLFIDLLAWPQSWRDRPVALTGEAEGEWGGLRPVEQLQAILTYLDAHVFRRRVMVPAVDKKFDDHGNLIDAATDRRLFNQARGFAEFVAKLRAT